MSAEASNPSNPWSRPSISSQSSVCRPFLPNIFSDAPPTLSHPAIRDATEALSAYFGSRFSSEQIDTLSVAFVTSDGALFEKNWGVLRANETGSTPVTSHSMYRLASVSKLFTVLEGVILEQRGVISWDDRVDKYLKDFKYTLQGLDPTQPPVSSDEAPITLAQLASHMSGMGRDWPPGTASGWPYENSGGGPPPINGRPFPVEDAVFEDLPKHPFVAAPWTLPSYSNTGIGVLGLALAAADRLASGSSTTLSHAELLKRDIFDPMGMNGSHFLATDAVRSNLIVSSVEPEVVDMDFLNPMNPSGGQFASLLDLITLAQTLLNAHHPRSQLSNHFLQKWLRPIQPLEDDLTEVGLVWEIVKTWDTNGRARRIYQKMGNVGGYHTAVTVNPSSGYGIVLLMAGPFTDSGELVYDAYEILQPAMDLALSDAAAELYEGIWTSGDSDALVVVDGGTLFVERLTLQGQDALATLGIDDGERVALRATRKDEFRLDIGVKALNGKRHAGCMPYWVALDEWGMRNNATINAIYFSGQGSDRRLHVPSLNIVMRRVVSRRAA